MYDPDDPHSWIVYGDGSYIATRMLWFTSRQLEASVLTQRTIELYLKAYLRARASPSSPAPMSGRASK
jgi:hypothetical protein